MRVDQCPTELPRGATQALLVLLALDCGSSLRDDVLIDRLWGESPPPSAVYSLRNIVTRLRRLLGPGVVVRTPDGYRLDPTIVSTDLDDFGRALGEAERCLSSDPDRALQMLDEAFALVRGTAFTELPDAPFAVVARRSFSERLLAAEERWQMLRLTLGGPGGDLDRFRAAVEEAPLREVRWANLIDALVKSGRRAEALREAQRARAGLSGVGLSPGPRLLAAEQSALESSDRLVRWSPGATLLEERRTTPIFGREDEIEMLLPVPELALVVGPRGSGKTRYLAELAARLREAGSVVLYARARREGAGSRFLADVAGEFRAADPAELSLTAAMQTLLDGREVGLLHPLPEIRNARLRSAAVDLFNRVPAGQEVVLLLDDVDHLDDETLSLLRDILESLRSAPSVVMALSDADRFLALAPSRDAHRLPEPVVVRLNPLSRDAVGEIVGAIVGAGRQHSLSDEILSLSGGNPSLVLEAVRQLGRASFASTAPSRLDEVIWADLSRRATEEQLVLAVLGLACRPVNAQVVSSASGIPESSTRIALEQLESARLVEADERDQYSIGLDLVASVALRFVPVGGVFRLRRRIAEAARAHSHDHELVVEQLLESFDGTADDAQDLTTAVHALLASLYVRADYAAMLEYGERYLACAGLNPGPPDAAEVLLLVATAMLSCGEVERGKALLDVVAERASRSANPTLLADAILARGPLETASRGAAEIAARAEEAISLLGPAEVVRRVQLACWSAHHRSNEGNRSHAVAMVESVLREATEHRLPTWRSLALLTLAQAEMGVDGTPRAARERRDELAAWFDLTNDETAEAGLAVVDIAAGFVFDDLETVRRSRVSLERLSVRLPRSDLRWLPHAVDASVALALGDVERSRALIVEAEQVGRRLKAAPAASLARIQQFLLARLERSFGRLAPFLEPAPDRAPRHELVAMWGLACVEGDDRGGAERAVSMLKPRSSLLNELGLVWPLVALAGAELAWFLRDAEIGERLWNELRHWSGCGLSVGGTAYAGAVDTCLGLAAAVTGRQDAAAALLTAAVEQEQRRGALPWALRAQELLGQVTGSGGLHLP